MNHAEIKYMNNVIIPMWNPCECSVRECFPVIIPLDTCGAGELVCVVLADEKARRGASALSVPRQTSAQQRLQRGTDQRERSLHGPAWYGEPALCHVAWLGGGVCSSYGYVRWGSVSEQRAGRHGAVQDPGRGALYCQEIPRPGWTGVFVQRVEVRRLGYRPLVSHGLFHVHCPLHHRHPHVSS